MPILIAAIYLLVSGSTLLTIDLGKKFALGTLITWIGIFALPASILIGIPELFNSKNKKYKIYMKVLSLILLISISWGFVAFWQAGNWEYIFENNEVFQASLDAASWYWIFNLIAIALSFVFLLTYFIDEKIIRLFKS